MMMQADVVIEGFRPGVMERLGLGPEHVRSSNPGLIYARMTGWGQTGPLKDKAAHDINYIGLTGMLHVIANKGRPPVPPLNVAGDYGGGAMMLLLAVMVALHERDRTGRGRVIDAAIHDGSALLMLAMWSRRAAGQWRDSPAANDLDGGAPFYRTYETADGRYLAVGCMEPKFYQRFINALGFNASDLPGQLDRSGWSQLRDMFASTISTRTLSEWTAIFDNVDACVSPVLTPDEAVNHPQSVARNLYRRFNNRLEPTLAGPEPHPTQDQPGHPATVSNG